MTEINIGENWLTSVNLTEVIEWLKKNVPDEDWDTKENNIWKPPTILFKNSSDAIYFKLAFNIKP
jgi:hypothetical protein